MKLLWSASVKSSKAQTEQMFSGLCLKASKQTQGGFEHTPYRAGKRGRGESE
jgi:hypothetical protein